MIYFYDDGDRLLIWLFNNLDALGRHALQSKWCKGFE